MEQQINPYYFEKLNTYYADNAKKLYRTVDKILLEFGGISNKDFDYFYVIASDVFADICLKDRYELSKGEFDTFLYSCLSNKIMSEITKRNRDKRKADRMSISIDTPIGDDENSTIGDMIAADFSIEKEIFEKDEEGYSKKMLLYLNRLSYLQKEVLRLNIAGYLPGEIKEELHINEKQYGRGNYVRYNTSYFSGDHYEYEISCNDETNLWTVKQKNSSYRLNSINDDDFYGRFNFEDVEVKGYHSWDRKTMKKIIPMTIEELFLKLKPCYKEIYLENGYLYGRECYYGNEE